MIGNTLEAFESRIFSYEKKPPLSGVILDCRNDSYGQIKVLL